MYNFTLRFHNATYKYEEKGHVYDFFKPWQYGLTDMNYRSPLQNENAKDKAFPSLSPANKRGNPIKKTIK